MKVKSFRVTKFRNIVDSGTIEVNELVTCLVGKNEAGKSGLLEALYLFNPAYNTGFDVDDQYPRWLVVKDRKQGDLDEHAPINVYLTLEEDDLQAVEEVLGENVLSNLDINVQRKYGGGTIWGIQYNEQPAVSNLVQQFPDSILPLFSKATSLDEVLEIIENIELSEEDDGSPSQDEINEAFSVLNEKGVQEISIWQRIVNILKPRLPQFFRFTSYSTLPGRIDFRELASHEGGPATSDLQTARALLALAGTDLSQLGQEDYELRKGELEAVQIDLTNQVFEYWKQNPHLEVIIDVDKETVAIPNGRTAVAQFLDIRLRDKRTGYSNNFSQRSSGFQWFFSFLAAFSEFEGKDHSPIVLLDEPALSLHGKAQADFLRFINERLAPNSAVLYTTHSPFMVEADRLDRVRIVEDNGPPTGAIATNDILSADPDTLFPLQAALGYDIAQNLFIGPHNLVVEGTSDFIYLTVLSNICKTSALSFLDERWRILPAGGAANIPTFVSLIGPHLDITVLADSDTKGMQRVKNMIEREILAQHRLVFADAATNSNRADIEDLFSEGDYLKLYNKTYNSSIRLSDLPDGDRIVKRIEAHLGNSFIHGEVAETLLKEHQSITFTQTSLDRFSNLFDIINATMQN